LILVANPFEENKKSAILILWNHPTLTPSSHLNEIQYGGNMCNSPSVQSNPSSPSASSLQHIGVLARMLSQTATAAFSARACRVVGDAAERAKRVDARRVRRWVVCILDVVFAFFRFLFWVSVSLSVRRRKD
jgi:hypothetical protein